MPRRRRLGPIGAVVLAAAAISSGCDGGEAPEALPGEAAGSPRSGGTLVYALSERPRALDPLFARSRAEQVISRQLAEPLVATVAGPFGDERRLPGLAARVEPSADRTVWRLALRHGVRFQDGSAFDAQAVLQNVGRWRTLGVADELLPGLIAADAPTPDRVRFILARPDPNLPDRLASPRLAIVSPRALRTNDTQGGRVAPATGTGPFELRSLDPTGVVVAPNPDWWGTERGLGPAFDQVEFRVVRGGRELLALLQGGEVQVADGLGGRELARAKRDPLLTVLGGAGTGLAVERSVRGIVAPPEIPSLSGAWLTRIATG